MKLETIQIGAFLRPEDTKENASKVLEQALPGADLESFKQNGPGQSQAAASIGDSRIIVTANPDRFDLHILPQTDPKSDDEGELDLETARKIMLGDFAAYAAKKSPVRLALVLSGSHDTDTIEETVDLFAKLAPAVGLPAGTNEIDFKINVPRQAKAAPGIMLNALHRWHSITAVMMIFGPQGIANRRTQPQLNEQIDINTIVDQDLSSADLGKLYAEMFELATAQIGKGPESLEVADG